jgi:hypothetical protein
VAPSRLLLRRMSWAAAFWTLCRQMMVLSGKPGFLGGFFLDDLEAVDSHLTKPTEKWRKKSTMR